MGLGRKIEFGWSAPAADFDVVFGAGAGGNGRMGQVGNDEHQVALPGFEVGDFFVGLFDLLGNGFHFRDDGVGVLFFFFQAGNVVTGFVALGFALFVSGDEFAALFVDGAEGVQVEGGVATFGHFGKNVEMIAEVAEVV